MWFGVISAFPEMFSIITNYGIICRAIKRGLLSINIWNPRNFTYDKRCTIDHRPYGGGPGMIMMAQPLRDAIKAAKIAAGKDVSVIYLSPQGYKFNQVSIKRLVTNYKKLIFVCGRYEGIDERIIQSEIDEEWSIGDYVLSGGELPAMVLIDSISRCIPGVLGCEKSMIEDSFFNGLLDCPHYTRPKLLGNMQVPLVLLSGNHKKIRSWRLKQSLGRTGLRRPELLKKIILTTEQTKLLLEFKTEHKFT